MIKTQTYNGADIFNIKFNLYPYDIGAYKTTIKNITHAFISNYKDDIKQALNDIGLKYQSLKWFSPQYYNYQGDSLDLTIKFDSNNLDKYKQYLLDNKDIINAELDKNTSYDGYIATTVDNVDEELTAIYNIQGDIDRECLYLPFSPDALILGYYLQTAIPELENFDIIDFIY